MPLLPKTKSSTTDVVIKKPEKPPESPKKPKENKKISKPKETEKAVKPKKSVKRLKADKTRPAKVKSAKTKPDKAKLAKTKPAKAKSAKTKPDKAKLAKTKPAKAKPAKGKPAKAKPAKGKPDKAKLAKAKPAKIKPAKAKPAKIKPTTAELAKAEPAKVKLPPSKQKQLTNYDIETSVSPMSAEYYAVSQVEAWCKGDCIKPSAFKKDLIREDMVVPVKMVLHGPLVPFPNYYRRIASFICNHLAYAAIGAVVLNIFLFTRNLNDLRTFKSHPFLCYLHPVFCSSFNLFAAIGILMMYKYDSASFMFVLDNRKRTSVFCKLLAYVCLCFGTLFLFHYAPWSFYAVNYPDSLHSWFGVIALILGFSSLTFVMKDYRWGQKKRKLTEFFYAIAFIFNYIAMIIAIINCIMFTSFPYVNVLYRTALVFLCLFIVVLVVQKPIRDWYKAYISKDSEEEVNIY